MGKVSIKCFRIEPYVLNGVVEITVFKLINSFETETRKESFTCHELNKIVENTALNCEYIYLEYKKDSVVKACGEYLSSFKSNYTLFYRPAKLLRIGVIYPITHSEKSDCLGNENVLVTNLSKIEWFDVQKDLYVFEGFVKVKSLNAYGLIVETKDGVKVISLTNDKYKPIAIDRAKEAKKRKTKKKGKRRKRKSRRTKKQRNSHY